MSNELGTKGVSSREPFSAKGPCFEIHEWRGSGPASLHVHHDDDEAWHVLEGELIFRYPDRTDTVGAGSTVFARSGTPHTYSALPGSRYLIILTPRLRKLIEALQSDRNPEHQREIYKRFNSELLE
jgi:cupin domain